VWWIIETKDYEQQRPKPFPALLGRWSRKSGRWRVAAPGSSVQSKIATSPPSTGGARGGRAVTLQRGYGDSVPVWRGQGFRWRPPQWRRA
jgi:hypothetical protein